jgi:hypothetical protein
MPDSEREGDSEAPPNATDMTPDRKRPSDSASRHPMASSLGYCPLTLTRNTSRRVQEIFIDGLDKSTVATTAVGSKDFPVAAIRRAGQSDQSQDQPFASRSHFAACHCEEVPAEA